MGRRFLIRRGGECARGVLLPHQGVPAGARHAWDAGGAAALRGRPALRGERLARQETGAKERRPASPAGSWGRSAEMPCLYGEGDDTTVLSPPPGSQWQIGGCPVQVEQNAWAW